MKTAYALQVGTRADDDAIRHGPQLPGAIRNKNLVSSRIPFPDSVFGGLHRARVALLGSGEMGGAHGDRRLQFVAYLAQFAFPLEQYLLGAAERARAPADRGAGQAQGNEA